MLRPFVRRALGTALYAYAVLIVALFLGQRSLLFPYRPPESLRPEAGTQDLSVPFDGGVVPMRVHPVDGRPLVVWFHGQGEQLASMAPIEAAFLARNLGFAAVEYPGYGLATGVGATRVSLLTAVEASMSALAALGYARPTCVGYSLGTGIATQMSANGLCSRLVLIAPYTSLADMAQQRYWYVPARYLLRDNLDSLALAPSVHVPVLVIHGLQDGLIDPAMGEKLAVTFPNARLILRDGDHSTIRSSATWDDIAAFVRASPTGNADVNRHP